MRNNLDGLHALLQGCSACGQCLAVCPAYSQTGSEQDSPRGRIALLLAFCRHQAEPCDLTASLAACTVCGKCESACPAGLQLNAAFLMARALVSASLPVSLQRKLAARLLALPPALLSFCQPAAALGQKITPARQPAIAPWPHKSRAAKTEGRTVLLYAGCLTQRFLPKTQAACEAALAASGFSVITAPELACCGRPLAMQGKNLAALIRKNLACLEKLDFDLLATPCPACLDTMLRIWPRASGLSAAELDKLAGLAARLRDITEILAGDCLENEPSAARDVFWHKPCLMSEHAAGRSLALLASRLKASSEPQSCCGAPLACLEPERQKPAVLFQKPLSLAEKLAAALRSGACGCKIVATACPGCILALQKALPVPVKHIVEICQCQHARR